MGFSRDPRHADVSSRNTMQLNGPPTRRCFKGRGDMDLRESLEIARHVKGCALLAHAGETLGILGAEGELALDAGHAFLACAESLGLDGEACFAASIDISGAQLVVRTLYGYLLVVRTDGALVISDAACDRLFEALMGTELPSPMDTGVRLRTGASRRRAS